MSHSPESALSQQDLFERNRANWDERTAIHLPAYGVSQFLAGDLSLGSLEREEVGDVTGRSMLHLQCHFGLDTLSWARLGATATGVDFSEASIAAARSLAEEAGVAARFICSNVYGLHEVLDERFDIVFASYGVLCWMPDINLWANTVAHFLRDGGTFYIADGHPLVHAMDDDGVMPEAGIRYFHDERPYESFKHGSYVGEEKPFAALL